MKNLRPETMGILERVQALSGRPVEFQPDSSLKVRATLQMARNGAPSHVLRYRPSNDPIDYWVAYQAGYALRMFELPPDQRFDFVGTGRGEAQLNSLLTVGQPLTDTDRANLPRFAEVTLHWALLNLRSFAIGMRIDQWIADAYPVLHSSQAAGMDELLQENLRVISYRVGNLSIPVPLLVPVAAYAKFADRLRGTAVYSIPYRAAGVLGAGAELLEISDSLEFGPASDCALVDAWAAAIGMTGWFAWQPYRP